jgi:hypothetical protein
MSTGPRHQKFEAVLGGALRRRQTDAVECPTPEVISAYLERSLSSVERERWETHFAECARCQQQIAAIARIETASGSSVEIRPSLWRFNWKWIAPLGAGAAALALVLMFQQRRAAVMQTAPMQLAARHQAATARKEKPAARPEDQRLALNVAPAPTPFQKPKATAKRETARETVASERKSAVPQIDPSERRAAQALG